MNAWLEAALDYLPQWLDYQLRQAEFPGAVIAVADRGRLVLEQALGKADLGSGRRLTPRHRFRVASHSKSFTAAAVMKLREQGRLGLDDAVGRHVEGLHPEVARTTLQQLLSHGAGLIRDGLDAGQWQGRRPFLNPGELRAALAEAPVLPASTRFKYSNHGFSLLGLTIEAVTGEPYRQWMAREVIAAAGLRETLPDGPVPKRLPLASGHSTRMPLGRRVVIPGAHASDAVAPAGGFVSTAGDLARFFSSLDPAAPDSLLSPASRRELIRRQWRDRQSAGELHYGLGIMSGGQGDWQWFGHGGVFPGYISHTGVLPAQGLTVSIVTNGADRLAGPWFDGALRILRGFAERGAPAKGLKDWRGRWWHMGGAVDLVPMGQRVLAAVPGQLDPFLDASELTVETKDGAAIAEASGLASPGERARLVRDRRGRVREVWLAGTRLQPERRVTAELRRRFEPAEQGE